MILLLMERRHEVHLRQKIVKVRYIQLAHGSANSQLVLGQTAIGQKANEINAIPAVNQITV
jgi:hypothetical protein